MLATAEAKAAICRGKSRNCRGPERTQGQAQRRKPQLQRRKPQLQRRKPQALRHKPQLQRHEPKLHWINFGHKPQLQRRNPQALRRKPKREAETRWVTKKAGRREQLLIMSPAQAPSVARVEESRRKTENVYGDAWVVDTERVIQGFDFSEDINKLCNAAWECVKPLWRERPRKKADENKVFHPFVKRIFNEISEAAQARHFKLLKVFHEYDNALENGLQRMDFCFTQPNEARSTHSSCMLPLEVKREDEKATDSEELLRQGLLQAIQRLFQRHDKLGKETTHGIAMATNGTHVIFVRLGLTEEMPDMNEATWSPYPCFITPTISFFYTPSPGAELNLPEELPAECPLGLKLWILLLCYAEKEHSPLFGLPPCSGMPECARKYEYIQVLGLGSFATVCLVQDKDTDLQYACKFARDDTSDAKIKQECDMLQHLAGTVSIMVCPKWLTSTKACGTTRVAKINVLLSSWRMLGSLVMYLLRTLN